MLYLDTRVDMMHYHFYIRTQKERFCWNI